MPSKEISKSHEAIDRGIILDHVDLCCNENLGFMRIINNAYLSIGSGLPPLGFVKLNYDAGNLSDADVGYEIVIRDDRAIDLGFRRAMAESDC
ncbi:hypothetical protein GH714_031938 [Hevea brasiliensis]|uniref:Uncharacterized protein n=1 Tax=Hevea brasiliensis TaxID=3981 RepID=A0A6A6N9Q0_HEVBR|nr:hypothetical protein GH714_031938 [Hevea brasiliensis]